MINSITAVKKVQVFQRKFYLITEDNLEEIKELIGGGTIFRDRRVPRVSKNNGFDPSDDFEVGMYAYKLDLKEGSYRQWRAIGKRKLEEDFDEIE